MTITFRVDDGHDTFAIPPASISLAQLGAFCALLSSESDRRQVALTVPENGDPADPAFSFDARVCPIALACLAACFDHDPAAITVLDEAQYCGRRVRIWKHESDTDIRLGLAWNPDAAPELNVSDSNAYAILDLLGLASESTGTISLAELRSRLSDPVIHRRLDAEPGLERYLPALLKMARLKPIDGELHLAWA